jgi:cytolysin-activating lysine-acyltransferase
LNTLAPGLRTNGAGTPRPPLSSAAKSVGARAEAASKGRMAQSFAQVVAVLMRDARFRTLKIADLEWLVLPPVMAGQFRLGHAGLPSGSGKARQGVAVPAALALWARVSPEVDKALSENLDKGVRLSPGAWTSGDILWLIAIGGHPRAVPAFLKQLREHEFKDRPVKMRRRMPDGARVVVDLHQPQSA